MSTTQIQQGDVIEKSETLHYRVKKTGGGQNDYQAMLVKYPACGYVFENGLSRPAHITSHSPEDFGLSPLRVDRCAAAVLVMPGVGPVGRN